MTQSEADRCWSEHPVDAFYYRDRDCNI